MACIIPFSEENQSITTREQFIAEFMAKRGDYNVFHAYYRELVQALYATGGSRYVFCVNVDAVIDSDTSRSPVERLQDRTLTGKNLETAALNVFLYGRMIGAAAEIEVPQNYNSNPPSALNGGEVRSPGSTFIPKASIFRKIKFDVGCHGRSAWVRCNILSR